MQAFRQGPEAPVPEANKSAKNIKLPIGISSGDGKVVNYIKLSE